MMNKRSVISMYGMFFNRGSLLMSWSRQMSALIYADLFELAKGIIGNRISLRCEKNSYLGSVDINELTKLRLGLYKLSKDELARLIDEQTQHYKAELDVRDDKATKTN